MTTESMKDIFGLLKIFLQLHKEMFCYEMLELIQTLLDEGKTFDEIKLEYEYKPRSIGFKTQLKAKDETLTMLNEFLCNLLQLGDATKFFELIQGNVSIDEKGLREAVKNKDKPKSNIIMLH